MEWQQADGDDYNLTGNECHEPFEGGVHEAIGVQADTQHVDAKPGETGDDIAKYREIDEAAVADETAPAGVQDQGVPQDDQQRAVFFRVPAPESAPGLVGPDAAQDGADEAKQRGKANDAIHHFGQSLAKLGTSAGGCASCVQFLPKLRSEDSEADINNGQQPGAEGRGISQRHHDDVRRKPKVGVEHGPQHFHRITAKGQVMRDQESNEPRKGRHDTPDADAIDPFEQNSHQPCAPANKNCR